MHANRPAISICLPVFNGGKYLAQAIESVIAQTYRDWELVISDDGSNDDSAQILESYAKLNSRIRVLEPAHRLGLFANYNRCIENAAGELIKPFAQDDILHPHCLQDFDRIFRQHRSIALAGSARSAMDEAGRDIEWEPLKRPAKFEEQGEYTLAELRAATLFPVNNIIGEPCAVMFRRKFGGTGFDTRFKHLGDLEYWLRILQHGTYFYTPKALCKFRRHAESASAKNERSLSFVPDLILLGRSAVFDNSPRSSKSASQFFEANIEAVGAYVASLGDAGSDGENEALASVFDHGEDAELLKETLVRSLLYIGTLKKRVNFASSCKVYEVLTKRREHHLKDMLSSKSWKLTKPLRELNTRFLARPHKDYFTATLGDDTADLTQLVSHQRQYLGYLRRQIMAVRASRSWQLTKVFRGSNK